MNVDEYAKMRQAEDHYWWFVSRRRLALALLLKYAPGARQVLDLGSGTGALLTELQSVAETTGLDYSPLAIAFCQERGLSNLLVGDAERLPFRLASFDAVVSLDTLEHVRDHESAVAGIAGSLRPGGVLVLNVPAFRWLWGPHDVALMHHRRYTRAQVRDLLSKHGLRVQRLSYSVFLLFPFVVLIRLLDKFKRGEAKVSLPKVSPPTNRFLVKLQDMEARWILAGSLPWGSSVIAVAKKDG